MCSGTRRDVQHWEGWGQVDCSKVLIAENGRERTEVQDPSQLYSASFTPAPSPQTRFDATLVVQGRHTSPV